MTQPAERTRFKTGEKCTIAGDYRFDGYLDGTVEPAPTPEEMEIRLEKGETFPPIRSAKDACWWQLIEED